MVILVIHGPDGYRVEVEGLVTGSLPYGTLEEALEQAQAIAGRYEGAYVDLLDDARADAVRAHEELRILAA